MESTGKDPCVEEKFSFINEDTRIGVSVRIDSHRRRILPCLENGRSGILSGVRREQDQGDRGRVNRHTTRSPLYSRE
jgi:hypothetical protein